MIAVSPCFLPRLGLFFCYQTNRVLFIPPKGKLSPLSGFSYVLARFFYFHLLYFFNLSLFPFKFSVPPFVLVSPPSCEFTAFFEPLFLCLLMTFPFFPV